MNDQDRRAVEEIMDSATEITASTAGAGLGFDHRADTFLDGISVSAALWAQVISAVWLGRSWPGSARRPGSRPVGSGRVSWRVTVGHPQPRLAATGYSSTRPLVPESDRTAVTVNRRVDVVVLSDASAEANALLPGIDAASQGETP